jgi:hypothetical protein
MPTLCSSCSTHQVILRAFRSRGAKTAGDGAIDEDEYCQVMALFGFSEHAAQASFAKLGKAKIGQEDFCKLWNEYFQSTDANAKGNHLFGDINK